MDNLEKLVRAERKKLLGIAVATGTVDKDAFDRLDRLCKLAAEAKPERRWLIPFVVFALLTIFIGLLVKEQHETEIDLDLAVSELHFRLPQQEQLTGDQFLRSLNAAALDGIVVDGTYWPAPKPDTCSLSVELVSAALKADAITLAALVPPKGWDVGVSRSGSEVDFAFTSPSPSTEKEFAVRAALRGKAALSTDCTPNRKNRTIRWNGPGSLTMRIGAATTLRCRSASPIRFADQIGFENLRLYAIEHYQTDTGPVDRRLSSVLRGTFYLDALNAKAVPLRPFEDLSLGSSTGYIRGVSVPVDSKPLNEELDLQAHATVRELNLGSGANERSQMPRWLELLAAQTGITLLWAAGIYAFGIIYAVLRWYHFTH